METDGGRINGAHIVLSFAILSTAAAAAAAAGPSLSSSSSGYHPHTYSSGHHGLPISSAVSRCICDPPGERVLQRGACVMVVVDDRPPRPTQRATSSRGHRVERSVGRQAGTHERSATSNQYTPLHVISSVLILSYVADRKSLDESSKIGVTNLGPGEQESNKNPFLFNKAKINFDSRLLFLISHPKKFPYAM